VEVSASTRLLAVIGEPVAHSLSPLMQNAAIRALGFDAVYVALRAPAATFPSLLTALAAAGGAGNVTVPHKEAAERCVARKTDLCARTGACNTFWTEQGELVGDNTDVPGVAACLKQLGVDGADRWLVVGTGGAARAVAIAAADARAQLHVLSRDAGRAQAFAAWARSRGAQAEPARGDLEPEIAINTTPLGLRETDPLPLDPARTKRLSAALDLVYAPGETPWVRALRAAAIPAQDGREMLVRQGAAAFTRFFPGHAAPTEVMRAAVYRALRA
jgi:shikimate dehydrogenase